MNEEFYKVWFHEINIPSHIKKRIYNRVESCKKIFELTKNDYMYMNLNDKIIYKIMNSKENLKEIEFILTNNIKFGIEIIDIEDENYPNELKKLDDAPIILYGRGNNKEALKKRYIAVVGARKCSEYGYNVTKKISSELVEKGLGIVSGMAEGIDAAAHEGALHNNGNTVAIFGTGLDRCYPVSNKNLCNKILEQGYVLSEYKIGTEPLKYNFPKRNRLISGMSTGVVITEARKKSGSFITADFGLEQGKEVFIFEADMNGELQVGTNSLIEQGATPFKSVEDIIEGLPLYVQTELNKNSNCTQTIKNVLDNNEIIVYDCLDWQPVSIDQISSETNFHEDDLNIILMKLDYKGIVKRSLGNRYSKVR
ncbi:DNA protecting protein DprA [Candidatus Epulonipiscium fishelsonii]|uniref:DNA protecting protein DprA n=1 Tax=Candidatus Epulonipiscium fishelsonii TaxID=77094 RepID=A0ACC8XH45_9FIRM|nr:DNA protecting protein DprA [Epulopiscium sp. SCG-B05WGA-EpuloA1]ONI42846.1 DNA protecting protein DprA [Epulopiscium sp. SCG-B11WGA-EpuloA1]